MDIFKKSTEDVPLFKSNYLGLWAKVYSDRLEFKEGLGTKSIPINQIASIQTSMMGMMRLIVETTGGKKYNVPTARKSELKQAIMDAQKAQKNEKPLIYTDELEKLFSLKEKGILTEEEFNIKKNQILNR